ncbi:MAG: tRNA lysidine(34) synthetase TilS [Pseudomonadota bacterium]
MLTEQFLPLLSDYPCCILAVSGGSDSMALMHSVADVIATHRFEKMPSVTVATVDHGLRPEAATEAAFVKHHANALGFEHTTLRWNPTSKAAQSVREARIGLLTTCAKEKAATAILLGHTLDDQAETVLMRALRSKPTSATRGLSAISPQSIHESIVFARPLLSQSRQELRDYLTDRNTVWVDDPSNEDTASERVRMRQRLAAEPSNLPAKVELARLATLAERTRRWMAQQSAALLKSALTIKNEVFYLRRTDHPQPVVQDVFAILTIVAGGQVRRVPRSVLLDAVQAHQTGETYRTTAGRALISCTKDITRFERENRAKPVPPDRKTLKSHGGPLVHDGRELYWLDQHVVHSKPFIAGLERYRPSCDDPIAHALAALHNKAYRRGASSL